MHILEVIVDGFKSYATRTVIAGFDEEFNAITGLNGSGKSNILDAICFVLGISNLSQVRVGNLQELVYKQGQAGITKASVTIVFDNRNKTKGTGSPCGYEHFDQITITRQVVIGGRNKYLINGHTAQQSQVANLFHSVQLNVNNPHFLIMQGRITKVLNMKPPEILGMIEEAAGTRMFENKKQAALKTIAKKQNKVQEMNQVLCQEITPTLEKLRQEKQQYMKWSRQNVECENLERFVIAYQYVMAKDAMKDVEEKFQELSQELTEREKGMEESKLKMEDLEKELTEMCNKKEDQLEEDFHGAKKKEELLSKELVKLQTTYGNKKSIVHKEEKCMKQIMESQVESSGGLEEKRMEIEKHNQLLEGGKQKMILLKNEMSDAEMKYSKMSAGGGCDDDDDSNESSKTLTDQMATMNEDISNSKSEMEQHQMKVKHLEKSSSQLTKETKALEKENEKFGKEKNKIEHSLRDIKTKLHKIEFKEDDLNQMSDEYENYLNQRDSLKDNCERLSAQLQGRLQFQYKDPEKSFDRSKVKGLVANLISVGKPSTATALEVVAGSKLYQVVVDTETTAKMILQKGGLKKRVTIIPLNKISHQVMETSKVQCAKGLAEKSGGSCHLALELIGYDDDVKNAMEHVFGSTLICDSMDIAKSITFNKNVRRRTVTLDGDVFDPAGTLTGGSKSNVGSLLVRLDELNHATQELSLLENKIAYLKPKIMSLTSAGKEFAKLTSDLEMKEQELELLIQRISQSIYTMHAEKLEEVKIELEESKTFVTSTKLKLTDLQKNYKELEKQEASLREEREKRLQTLEKEVDKTKKAYQTAANTVKKQEQKVKVLELELTDFLKEVDGLSEQVENIQKSITKAKNELEETSIILNEKEKEYNIAKTDLNEKKALIISCDKQMTAIEKEKDKTEKKISTDEIEKKKLQHKIQRFEKDNHSNNSVIRQLLKTHSWIETEQKFFGKPHTDYDFEEKDPLKANQKLKDLQDEQQNLGKKINKKVMGMIEKVESEYQELMQKKTAIENDKKKIESVISELDVKKNQALQTTWVKVNRDFGSMFSTLLPGTSAKLDPPENGTVLDGLEVKVAFGSVWKETLTELSGGQRSLLALSLILALLLFKPAPMYILDEVDAALDLSHTQNIGSMLKTHFSQSQFIVVSLKEGMFNNANVIFRTKFVDGVSTVTRTIGAGANKTPSSSNNEKESSLTQRKRGKTANNKTTTKGSGRRSATLESN